MALLSSCWLIIECFIIPDGFVKWYYLSFYIHPFFLFFCQIFLWLRWPTYIILFLHYKFTCYLYSLLCFSFRRFIIIICSYTGYRSRDSTEVVYDVPEHRNIPRLTARNDQNQIVDMYSTATSTVSVFLQSNYYEVSVSEISEIGFVQVHYESSKEVGDADEDEDSSSGEEEGLSSGDELISTSPPSDVEMNLYLPSLSNCSTNSIVEQELIDNREDSEEEIDAFYKIYTERMRWFDVLNHDRAFALSTIRSKDIISIESEEEGDMSWAKMAKKRMVNSLENDFEMVYVAQSCLTWEALNYQHQKVESLIECSSSNSTSTSQIPSGAFHYNSRVAGNFQKFKILLERFMEDERFGSKRCWNYVQKRSSLKSLLQVPDISQEEEEEKEGRKGEAIRATEMLKAIEKCIKTFYLFLQNERRRRQWWKANSLLWSRPPLEDTRNLMLLHHLIKTLQQKEVQLKDLKGKKWYRWWRMRTVLKPLEESEKKEMLFTTIEMKLVSRVLSMPMISTLQLNWCQEKLNNIDFKEGKVIRSCTIAPLFPSS